MFHFAKIQRHMDDSWKSVTISERERLFRISNYLFVSQGRSYSIEVQEAPDGTFLAHGENTSDPHDVLRSVTGTTMQECLQAIVDQIERREEKQYEVRTP